MYLHGANPALHPHEPFDHLPVFVRIEGIRDLAVGVVLQHEIQHYGPAFEDGRFLRFAVGFPGAVNDCWDTAICYNVLM